MRTSKILMGSAVLAVSTTALAHEPKVVAPEQLASYWVASHSIAPEYAPVAARAGLQGCYLVDFTIDATGAVNEARIAISEAEVEKMRGGVRLNRRDLQRIQGPANEGQQASVLAAVAKVHYEPAESNPDRVPVRTRTVPIVVSLLMLDDAKSPEAIAAARGRYDARRQQLWQRCEQAGKAL
jgi:hypothetical protein